MTAPALAARGLDKSFGSLVVARDIELALPRGARYALIGPNGAGKTTLINLMTGMLRPDAGRILLGDEDVTRLEPEQRVKRGLVRTFQVNALFPGLNALESVTLAVCERRGVAARWWHRLTGYREEVVVHDRLRGEVRATVDDLVLRRNDGIPSYNLATVVDDAAAGVQEVVRGDDLLDTTPRQVLLARLLDLPVPAFSHVPLVVGPDG